MSKIELFKELSNYNPITGRSRIVDFDEYIGRFSILRCNNGIGWLRNTTVFYNEHKIVKIRANRSVDYNWNIDESEKNTIASDVVAFTDGRLSTRVARGTTVIALLVYGKQDTAAMSSRSIRSDIRKQIITEPCVVCGTRTQIECDHKNPLYNDARVLNLQTQTINDFQPLCKHCNDVKRQVYKNAKRTKNAPPVLPLPFFKSFIDILDLQYNVQNDTLFDPEDMTAIKDNFWYDPLACLKNVALYLKQRFDLLTDEISHLKEENQKLRAQLQLYVNT